MIEAQAKNGERGRRAVNGNKGIAVIELSISVDFFYGAEWAGTMNQFRMSLAPLSIVACHHCDNNKWTHINHVYNPLILTLSLYIYMTPSMSYYQLGSKRPEAKRHRIPGHLGQLFCVLSA